MKRAIDLKSDRVESLMRKLAIPSFLGIVINLLYGFIDGIFIGKGVGTAALGGVTVVFPLTIMVISFAALFGEGLASIVARAVAAGKEDQALDAIRTAHAAALSLSVALILFSFINMDMIMQLLGATSSIGGFAKSYYRALMPGLPFMSVSLVYFHQLNAQGEAKLAMKAMAVSTLLNIILDYAAIYQLNMGVAGAAYATVLSQIAWYGYMHAYSIRDVHILTINNPIRLTIKVDKLKEIILLGFGSFIRQVGVSIAMILINIKAGEYGSETYIAAFGATQRIFRLMIAPIAAVSMAFKPIAGQNYGFKSFERVKEAVVISMRWNFGLGLVLLSVIVMFRVPFAYLFGMGAEAIPVFVSVLMMTTFLFPLYGVHHLAVAYFTALGKPKQAIGLNLLKQVVVLIPLIYVLPRYFGIMGLFAAIPISDAVSIGFALVMMKKDFAHMAPLEKDRKFG